MEKININQNNAVHDSEYDTDTADIVCKIEKVNQEMIRMLLAGASNSHICQ